MQSPWIDRWQKELRDLLTFYAAYKARRPYFFVYLFLFFFLINALCFWLATVATFPQLLDEQPWRMVRIQQPVAVLGGLFDALSFFLTVWLVRQASVAVKARRFFGILSMDLLIALVATAWVLMAVIFSSWLVGPPDMSAMEGGEEAALVSETRAVVETAGEVEPEADVDIGNTTDTALPADQEPIGPQPVTEPAEAGGETLDEGAAEESAEFGLGFYQNLLVDALERPFEKLEYFVFAIIMGLSTLLPTSFHVVMAVRSLWFRKTRTVG